MAAVRPCEPTAVISPITTSRSLDEGSRGRPRTSHNCVHRDHLGHGRSTQCPEDKGKELVRHP